jgi:hypothetical protein
MATLTGQTIAATYDALLKVTDNGPITSSLKLITDGLGNNTALSLSSVAASITGTLSVTSTIGASNLSGTNTGDETNATIKTKLGAASASQDGYLTSTDWSTFNNKVPASRTLTINGTAYDLSADRSWTIVAGVSSFNTRTGAITLTSLDVTDALGFTPVTNARTLTINGTSYDLSANRSWTISTGVSGSGTTNYVSKFTSSSAIGNSLIYNDANSVLINDTFNIASNYKLQVTGDIYTSGSIAIGSVSSISTKLFGIGRAITGATTAYGITFEGNIESTVTTNGIVYRSYPIVTGGTLSAITHYIASKNAFIGGSSVTNQYGFFADASVIDATNNYGFYGNIASATSRWNLYMNGTAQNYINGNLGIGVTVPTVKLDVSGAGLFSSSVTAGSFIKSGGTSAQLLAGDGSVVTAGTNITISGGTISSSGGLSGSGTTNYVTKFTGSTSIGNSQIFDNGTNVGIGTSSPSYKLQVRNDISASTSLEPIALGLYNNSDSGSAIYFNNGVGAQSKLSFGVEGTGAGTDDTYLGFSTGANASLNERMRITSAGNVGIGTSSPSNLLHLYGGGANTQTIRQESSISAANAYLVQQSASKTYITGLSTDFSNSYIIYDATASAMRLAVTTTGNVGIGTSAPAGLLDLNSASANDRLVLSYSGSPKCVFGITTAGVSYLYHHTSSSFPMWISAAGNFGIGTTSPTRLLSVNSQAYISADIFQGQNSGIFFSGDGSYATGVYGRNSGLDLVFQSNSAERARIASDGRFQVNNTGYSANCTATLRALSSTGTDRILECITISYTSAFYVQTNGSYFFAGSNLSDARTKKDINYLEESILDKVMKLKPASFRYKENEENIKGGFIAQDIKEIFPDLVTATKSDDEMMGVDYYGVIAILTKAIQELTEKVNKLENK